MIQLLGRLATLVGTLALLASPALAEWKLVKDYAEGPYVTFDAADGHNVLQWAWYAPEKGDTVSAYCEKWLKEKGLADDIGIKPCYSTVDMIGHQRFGYRRGWVNYIRVDHPYLLPRLDGLETEEAILARRADNRLRKGKATHAEMGRMLLNLNAAVTTLQERDATLGRAIDQANTARLELMTRVVTLAEGFEGVSQNIEYLNSVDGELSRRINDLARRVETLEATLRGDHELDPAFVRQIWAQIVFPTPAEQIFSANQVERIIAMTKEFMDGEFYTNEPDVNAIVQQVLERLAETGDGNDEQVTPDNETDNEVGDDKDSQLNLNPADKREVVSQIVQLILSDGVQLARADSGTVSDAVTATAAVDLSEEITAAIAQITAEIDAAKTAATDEVGIAKREAIEAIQAELANLETKTAAVSKAATDLANFKKKIEHKISINFWMALAALLLAAGLGFVVWRLYKRLNRVEQIASNAGIVAREARELARAAFEMGLPGDWVLLGDLPNFAQILATAAVGHKVHIKVAKLIDEQVAETRTAILTVTDRAIFEGGSPERGFKVQGIEGFPDGTFLKILRRNVVKAIKAALTPDTDGNIRFTGVTTTS